jgi:hypothetical protein
MLKLVKQLSSRAHSSSLIEDDGLFPFLKEVQERAEDMSGNKTICRSATLMMNILPRRIFSLITETSPLSK